MSNLKANVLGGVAWNLLDNVINKAINVLCFIVLARLLLPEDFGLIGMLMIFITFSKTFVDSGLSQALIKRENCTNADYNTVLFFNILIGIILYILIYFLSPFISRFFNVPELERFAKVVSVVIIIGSFTIVQQTKLTKALNFKVQAIISFIANIVSGSLAIYLAFQGYGVWSLIWRTIILQFTTSILLWLHNKWLPTLEIDLDSFKEMLRFSYKILISLSIADIFKNIYNLIIGKFYSATILGYYTTANNYSGMIPFTLNTALGRVIFPAYAEIQNDNIKLKETSKKITKGVMFITFTIMFTLTAIARPLFNVFLGAKWEPSIIYFQILCLGYMILPLIPLNHTILYVKGRSDLVLVTDIIKYILIIPFVVLGLYYGMEILVIGATFFWWVSFFICAMFNKRMINYSIKEQVLDITPYFLISITIGIIIYSINYLPVIESNIIVLALQVTASIGSFIGINELLKPEIYIIGKSLLLSKINSWKNKRK